MAGANTTTRLSIPYPVERATEWWGVEHDTGGRMDTLDQLLAIALENPMLKSDGLGGYLSVEPDKDDFFLWIRGGDFTIRSARGGDITFAQDSSVQLSDGDFIWFVPSNRPIAVGETGVFEAGPVAPWDAVVVGWFYGFGATSMHIGIWPGGK